VSNLGTGQSHFLLGDKGNTNPVANIKDTTGSGVGGLEHLGVDVVNFGSLIKSLLGDLGSGKGFASEFDKTSPAIGAAGSLDTTNRCSTTCS
jgi:hypothetical protein